ncbi:MAG: putative GTP-binding protein YjiA [Methanomassiliicoccales archaeon PtaU1.Bin124]|nr:MAG: putative GTP-binding protein YjiA [Methanomassiliicoccales archaeon PtaU1.Bin124]
MIICLISGFLGSGKTTLMIDLGKRLGKRGKRVAIIVNEVGEVGVDGALIDSYGLNSVELTEGCICCSLSGSLTNTLRTVSKDFKADFVFIEPTGIALPSKINNLIRTSMVEYEDKLAICVVDAYRAEKIYREAELFFRRQIEDVDVVALNKCDLVDDAKIADVSDLLHGLNPKAQVLVTSAKRGDKIDDVENMLLARVVA